MSLHPRFDEASCYRAQPEQAELSVVEHVPVSLNLLSEVRVPGYGTGETDADLGSRELV